MRPPLFGIRLGLDLQLIGYPFALQFPIILANSTDNNLFILINCSIATMLFPVIHFLFLSHFNLIHHFIPIINLLISLIGFFLLEILHLFVFGFFKIKVFAFECFWSQLIENRDHLLATAGLQLEGWKLTLNTNLFALVNNGRGDSHGIVELGKVWWRNIIELKEPLNQATIMKSNTSWNCWTAKWGWWERRTTPKSQFCCP